MTELVIRSGRVLDETGERNADVLVRDGVITAVAERIEVRRGATVLDAGGCFVAPGLVDLHAHLREPGGEGAETIVTGARAGALGGYTAVIAMPNTDPAIDSAATVRDVLALAAGAAAEVSVAGAITTGRAGAVLSPMAEMAALGVRIFTDDGRGVQDGGLMRRALEYAGSLGVVLAQHCEDESLAAGGHMHEGAWSSRLGIPGQPSVAEEAMVARDLALVALTGCPMHFLHLSTTGSVDLVGRAKAAALPVTAEVTPHHLTLTDEAVASYDSNFKVSPPLRTVHDVDALRAGLAAGAIDAIATDHAPHTTESKDEPFECAPPGVIGLETAVAVAHSELCVESSVLGVQQLFAALSWKPARIARLPGHGGPVRPGAPANLCVFDPALTWQLDRGSMASRSRNTPFSGRTFTGKVRHTLLRGEPVVVDGEAQR